MPRNRNLSQPSPLKRLLDEEFAFDLAGGKKSKIVKGAEAGNQSASKSTETQEEERQRSQSTVAANTQECQDASKDKEEHSAVPDIESVVIADQSQIDGEPVSQTAAAISPGSTERRNLSLEALFQVTDTELQNITKQHPDVRQSQVVTHQVDQSEARSFDNDESEGSQDTTEGLIGEPGVYREAVKIPVTESGVEKYQLKSDTLEEQGLKLVYIKQTGDLSDDGSNSPGKPKFPLTKSHQQAVDKLLQKASGENNSGRKRKHPQKPGRHVCTYCGRRCAKPSVLEKHIRAHTGERPYPCLVCGFSFKTKSNLNKHCKSRAHAIKTNFEEKKKRLGSDEQEDDIPRVALELEIGDDEVEDEYISDDSATESGEEEIEEVDRRAQAPSHVLQEVAKFLERSREDRPKVETKKGLSRSEKTKTAIENDLDTEDFSISKKSLMQSSSVQLMPFQSVIYPKIAPKQVEEQSELPPTCKSDEWKGQFSEIMSQSEMSSVLLTNSNQGKQSYNEVEVVNLPSPNTDAETSTKALRNLEKLSEKFEIATKEGVRLSTCVHTLENKQVQVMIQLQQPAGRAQKMRRSFSEQPSVSSEKTFPKEPSVSLAALRDRIQQLISANEAIVDTPKIDPPRPKVAKKLARQNSESGIIYRSESVEAVSSISSFSSSSGISAIPGQQVNMESLFGSADTGTRGTPPVSLTQEQISVIVSHFQDWKGDSSVGQVSKGGNSVSQISKGDKVIVIAQETTGLGNSSWSAQAIKTESEKKTEVEKEIPITVGQLILPGTSSVPVLITNSGAVVMPVNKTPQSGLGVTLVQSLVTSAQQQQQQLPKQEILGTQQIQSQPDVLSGTLHQIQVSQSGDTGPSLIYTLPNMQTNTSETSSRPVVIVSASAGEKQRSGQTNLQKPMMVTSTSESVSISNTKFQISESKPGLNLSHNSTVIPMPYQTVSLTDLPQSINVSVSHAKSLTSPVSSALHPAIVRSRSVSDSEPVMYPATNTRIFTHFSTPTSIKTVNMLIPPVTTGSSALISVPQAFSRPMQKLATSQTAPLTPQKVVTLDNNEQIKLLSALLPTKVSAEVKGDNSKHSNEPQEIKIEFKLNKGGGASGSSSVLSSGHVHEMPSIRFQTANISSKSACAREPTTPIGPVFRFQNAAVSSSHNNQSTVILTPSQVMTSFKHAGNPVVLTQKSIDVTSPNSRIAHPVFRFQMPTSTLPQREPLPGNVIQITDSSAIRDLLLKSKQGEATHFSTHSSHSHYKQVTSKVISASVDEYGPYRCSFCNTSFLKEQTLELHNTYYCKEKPVSLENQQGAMGSDSGNAIDKEAVAKLFANAGVTMRVNTDKDDDGQKQEIEQIQDGVPKSSLIFENFEPTIWPKKKGKPKTLRSKSQSFSLSSLTRFDGQKDWATLLPVGHQDTVGIPIIITDIPVTSFSAAHSSQQCQFIPISQAKTNSSTESSTAQSIYRENKQSEWKPKLKGQILMRKLKKKVLMKRSISFDPSVMERSSESESTQHMASGDHQLTKTKSVVERRKSKELYDNAPHVMNTGLPNIKEQLKKLRLSRSESVIAIKDDESKLMECSDDVVVIEVSGSRQEIQDKTALTWQLKNVHVPVVLAQPIFAPLTPVTPIYQSNHSAHPGGLVCYFSTDIHMAVLRSSHGKIPTSLLGKFKGLLVPATPLEKQIPFSVNNSIPIPILIGARTQSQPLNISESSGKENFEDKPCKNDGGGNSTAETSAEKAKDVMSSEGTTNTKIQYLYGHSYPSLRGGTYVTFCCLQRPQPMYVLVGNNKKVSMYSNWRTAQKDPNPYGLTTKMLLSLYDSHYVGNPVFVTSKETSPAKGLVTHSSYWTYKQKQVLNLGPVSGPNKIQIKAIINMSKITEDRQTDSKSSLKQVGPSGKDRQGNIIVLNKEDSQEKIIKGGFKSLDPYVYVRGRGRGKYVCQTCGIRCKKPSMLKKHIRTHTDFRPYHCRHCRFSFKTKGNLTKHMKSKSHQKRCIELGIVPVPTAIDDSQIDQSALAAQFAMTKDAKIADLFDSVYENEAMEEDVDKDGEEEEEEMEEEEGEGEEEESNEEEDIDEGEEEDLAKANEEEVGVSKSLTEQCLSTSKESSVSIIVHSVGTSSPQVTCPSQMNRNLFLQTLGIVAKQLVNGDEHIHVPVSVTRLVPCSLQQEVNTEFIGEAEKQTSLIASSLSTVYGFGGGELSKEGYAEKKKKDSETAWSLLNLSEQSKSTQGGDDNPKSAVQFVDLTKGDYSNTNPTSPDIITTDATETPKIGSYSADNIKNTALSMITIPLGGFVPPIRATPINIQSSDQLKSLLKSGPIVGQLIRQETGKLDLTSESSTTTVFIPFQFSHPFSGSDIIISPVKVGNSHEFAILSPVKKSAGTETLLVSHQNIPGTSNEPVVISPVCITPSNSIKSPSSDTLVTSLPFYQEEENTLVLASLTPGSNGDGSFHVVRTQPASVYERSSLENKLISKNQSSTAVEKPSFGMSIVLQDHKERTLTGPTEKEPLWSQLDSRGLIGPEKLVCSICGKSFPEKQQLILHYSAHIIEKPFRCGMCSVSFKTENQLQKHLSSEQHLSNVEKNNEGTDLLAENPRPFRCDLCQTAFRIKGHLVKHFRSKAHFTSIESTGKLTVGSYEKVEKFLNYINTSDHEEFLEAVKVVISGDSSKLKIEHGEKALADDLIFKDSDCFPDAAFQDGGKSQGHNVVIETESMENPSVMEQISHGHFQKHVKVIYEVPALGSGEKVRVELNPDYIELGDIGHNNRANVSDDSYNERDIGDVSDKSLESSANCVIHVTTEEKSAIFNVAGTSSASTTEGMTAQGDTTQRAVTSGGRTVVNTSQGGITVAVSKGTTTPGITTSGVSMATVVPQVGTTVSQVLSTSTRASEVMSGVATVTRATMSLVTEGPHLCGICRQGFKDITMLKNHLITHAELRPYVCEYCDAGFTNGQSLKIHLNTHTQESPYVCGLCGNTFASLEQLRNHSHDHMLNLKQLTSDKGQSSSESSKIKGQDEKGKKQKEVTSCS